MVKLKAISPVKIKFYGSKLKKILKPKIFFLPNFWFIIFLYKNFEKNGVLKKKSL